MTAADFAARLQKSRPQGQGFEAQCPAHEDKRASLSVRDGDAGRVVVYCHAGCSVNAICAAVGLELRDLMPPRDPAPATRRWEIRTVAGELVATHHRQEPGKKIWWERAGRSGLQGLPLRDLPLYRSEDIPGFDRTRWVYLCEGEKACDALRALGVQALGTVTGASSCPSAAILATLQGLRVRLWPDNDDVGRTHMQRVAEGLRGVAAEVETFAPKGLPEHGDAVEWDAAEKRAGRSPVESLEQAASNEPKPAAPEPEPIEPGDDEPPPDNAPSGVVYAFPRYRRAPREWGLVYNDKGVLTAVFRNAVSILASDADWRDVLAWDAFRAGVVARAPLPCHAVDSPKEPTPTGTILAEEDYLRTALWLSRTYGPNFAPRLVMEAIMVVAQHQTEHPVRSYLEALRWDKTPRLAAWTSRYLGAADTDYNSDVGRWFLLSAVARIFEPGCKADVVLILEGPQGAGKSSALRTLAGVWFSDTPFELGSKDSFLVLRGRWIVELAELDSLSRAEANRAKAFFSSPIDVYRPPYGREVKEIPRQCVFAGSTNQTSYLRDETGGRRFWPVRCGPIQLAQLAKDRDQIWAEAVTRYRAKERWYPATEEEVRRCLEQQGERYQSDPWEDRIANYLTGRMSEAKKDGSAADLWASVDEILEFSLKLELAKAGQGEKNRVVAILKRCAWEPCGQRSRVLGGEKKRYRAHAPTAEAWKAIEPS